MQGLGIRPLWFVVLGVVNLNCAAVLSKPAYQSFGDAQLEHDAEVLKTFEKRRDKSDASPEGVRVLLDTLPVGLSSSLMGGLTVDEGYDHKIVGKFSLSPRQAIHYFVAGFPKYEDRWRRGLCYWQSPLQWITMGFWSLVPLDYPCHPTPWRKKTTLTREAKVMAEIVGADAVIMSFMIAQDDEAMGATGVFVALDPRVKGSNKIETKPLPTKGGHEVLRKTRPSHLAAAR